MTGTILGLEGARRPSSRCLESGLHYELVRLAAVRLQCNGTSSLVERVEPQERSRLSILQIPRPSMFITRSLVPIVKKHANSAMPAIFNTCSNCPLIRTVFDKSEEGRLEKSRRLLAIAARTLNFKTASIAQHMSSQVDLICRVCRPRGTFTCPWGGLSLHTRQRRRLMATYACGTRYSL